MSIEPSPEEILGAYDEPIEDAKEEIISDEGIDDEMSNIPLLELSGEEHNSYSPEE